MTDAEIQRAFAQHTLDVEARRDGQGRLRVYYLPAGDGGGEFEVAGINDRYHPQQAHVLKRLIEGGQHAQAEESARRYIENYTGAVDEWVGSEVCEGYLRCCAFNRGARGAGWILQYALRYGFTPALYDGDLDGQVGPKTRASAARVRDDSRLLLALMGARVVYERTTLPWKTSARTESSVFWHGLFQRFVTDALFAVGLTRAATDRG